MKKQQEAKQDARRHQNKQHFLFLWVSGGSKAARIASSNTFFSPRYRKRKQKHTDTDGVRWRFVARAVSKRQIKVFLLLQLKERKTHARLRVETGHTWVRAEHSTYLTALRSLASFSAVSGVIGFCLFLANFSTVEGSSRRSIWVPTNRNGVLGQWWVISGTHWRRRTDAKKEKCYQRLL